MLDMYNNSVQVWGPTKAAKRPSPNAQYNQTVMQLLDNTVMQGESIVSYQPK